MENFVYRLSKWLNSRTVDYTVIIGVVALVVTIKLVLL